MWSAVRVDQLQERDIPDSLRTLTELLAAFSSLRLVLKLLLNTVS